MLLFLDNIDDNTNAKASKLAAQPKTEPVAEFAEVAVAAVGSAAAAAAAAAAVAINITSANRFTRMFYFS